MKITVLHNISRDAGFGLNNQFSPDTARNGGRTARIYRPRTHELVRVFEFDADDSMTPDDVYRAFNVGDDPDFSESPGEYDLAVAYGRRRLRPLSPGDVLAFETRDGIRWLACEPGGWKTVPAGDLLILGAEAAEAAVRRYYEFRPGEELAITVPLPDPPEPPAAAAGSSLPGFPGPRPSDPEPPGAADLVEHGPAACLAALREEFREKTRGLPQYAGWTEGTVLGIAGIRVEGTTGGSRTRVLAEEGDLLLVKREDRARSRFLAGIPPEDEAYVPREGAVISLAAGSGVRDIPVPPGRRQEVPGHEM